MATFRFWLLANAQRQVKNYLLTKIFKNNDEKINRINYSHNRFHPCLAGAGNAHATGRYDGRDGT